VRAWSWIAAGSLLLVAAVSCLERTPSHRANAQPKTEAASPAPAETGGAAATSEKAQPAGDNAGEKTTEEIILEHADRVRYDNKTKWYTLTGDIVLRHEDGVLHAQTLRMNSETKKGEATGDLSFADEQTTLTADRLEIDFDARVAVFKGNVRMVTQRKPAAGEESAAAPAEPLAATEPAAKPPGDEAKATAATGGNGDEEVKPFREYWKDRTEIRCPELTYYYREDRAVATGGITARQKDLNGRADEAVYTDKDELLVLSGNVQMENERGETFHARKITVSIADDWLEAEGATGSRFLVEEEKGKAGSEPAASTKEQPASESAQPPGPKPAKPASSQ
jgi:lipopolysaccharide assembly outer membrane protein LptD (OstA)